MAVLHSVVSPVIRGILAMVDNATGASTSHEFAAEGEYPVTLTVSDGVSSHQKEKIVYVYRDTIPIEIDLAYVVNEQTIQVIFTKEVDTTSRSEYSQLFYR